MSPAPINRLSQFALALCRLSQCALVTLEEERIVEAAVSGLVDEGIVTGAILWLVTSAGKMAVKARRLAFEALPEEALEIEIGQGRVGRIAADQRSLITTRLRGPWTTAEIELLQSSGIQFYAGLALIFEKKAIGVLEIFHNQPLGGEETELLSGFVRQLATSIEQARSLALAQSEVASARLLRALNDALAQSDDPRTFAGQAARIIGGLNLADSVIVTLWSQDEQRQFQKEFRTADDLPSIAEFAEQGRHPPLARYLLTTTAPVVIESAEWSPNFIVQRLHRETGLRALCCLPVVIGKQVRGSVDLFRFQPSASWSVTELQLATQAARQLSWGLRVFEAEGPAIPADKSLETAFERIRDALDTQAIVTTAVDAIALHFHAARAYGFILPTAADWRHQVPWNQVITAESLAGARSCLDASFPVEGHAVFDVLSRSLRPIAVDDVSLSSLFPSQVRARLGYLRVRSLLVAPVVFNNQMNGVLAVHADRERNWQPEDLQWISQIADQAAIAIKYVRLFEDAAAEAQHARTLVETLRLALSSPAREPRLNAFTGRLRRVFSADIAFAISIRDAESDSAAIMAESFHEAHPGPLSRKIAVPLRNHQAIARALETPHAAALRTIESDDVPRPIIEFYQALGVQSLAACARKLAEDEVLVFFLCVCGRDRVWKEQELRLFEELCELFALASATGAAAVQPARVTRDDARAEMAEAIGDALAVPKPYPGHAPGRENIERAVRNLEELVSTAAHDLQSPLVSIEGYLTRLEQDLARSMPGRPSQIPQSLERIRANTEQMQRLIRSLLDVSRLQGDTDLDQTVDTRAVVEKLRLELQPKLEGLKAELILSTEMPVVTGSKVRIAQVFSNLVNNALNYRHPNRAPVIEIGCAARGADSEFYVRDNGIGIRPEDFDKIFKPLSRLKQVEVPGTGMGLYIVQRIVEKHGGHIWVDSRAGAGATFCFTVPRQAPG